MITFIYGILAGIGSAISFGSFGEPHMDNFLCLRSLCELKLCQRQPDSQTLSLALVSRRANQMQTDYGCQGGFSCFQGLSFCLTSSLTASIAKAGPDRHALTCAGASLCVPDLQELGLLPDKLHCAGVELAGQVHLVGDGECLSQSISPRAALRLHGSCLRHASFSPGKHCLPRGCVVTCPTLPCRSAQQSG